MSLILIQTVKFRIRHVFREKKMGILNYWYL